MSRRDREIVEDYKRIFASMLSGSHLHLLEGDWYLVTKDTGHAPPVIDRISSEEIGERVRRNYEKEGFTLTPLIIYKVDTQYVR